MGDYLAYTASVLHRRKDRKGMGTTVDDLVARTFTERRPASLLQRYAEPEEIANLICYVCSKAASATNGAALRVDGGIVTNPF